MSLKSSRPPFTARRPWLLDIAQHTRDAAWHEENRERYERVLREPSQAVVDALREEYIQKLNPAVASAKRPLSILKKNDYGRGGYNDHFWFAFYDPASGSRTKSVQLFVRFLGGEQLWRYGFGMGDGCSEYVGRLLKAIGEKRKAVAEYLRRAPPGTKVALSRGEATEKLSPEACAQQLLDSGEEPFSLVRPDELLAVGEPVSDIAIIREDPLETLPDHAETIVQEVGEYFTWLWPFFQASMTGAWPTAAPTPSTVERDADELDVDETAPTTLQELANLTALPQSLLSEMEQTLWAKRQVILVGPPGTSKTFIARQFARYFVRQRSGQPQGTFEMLYMHANWGYEDFFEGIKPTTKDGALTFESRMGFFLEWVAKLAPYSAKSRHILVLDEINRCDTAAVLGELLQLLEYRGTTVRLLSGRNFVFPNNVFIIGTMNSADRSIGRLDMALQRRFFWLNLHPQTDTLGRWLKRPGNNPLGFRAETLDRCNKLLGEHGIPPQQQIGHALFMLQRTADDDESSPKLDVPLSKNLLQQTVNYSVLPYVRELLMMQLGHADEDLLKQISSMLLECLNRDGQSREADHGLPPA